MNKELDEKLVKKYPKIFVNRNGDMRTTCMCWGFECGDGWYWLIDNLCNSIQSYIDNNSISQVITTQVKEKFGGLRFYYDGGNEKIDGMVWLSEHMSYHICEVCGSTENIGRTKGWMFTLCEKCGEGKNWEKI